MKNSLLYLSKNNIPFIEAQVNIHQPTINEISLIGEESFHIGCQFLIFSSDKLVDKDKLNLGNKTDFEIFMSIMNSKDKAEYVDCAKMVLLLLFPDYNITFTEKEIVLQNASGVGRINNFNYDAFKEIVINMFKLNESGEGGEAYNPADAYAAKIAERFKKRQQKLANLKGESTGSIAIFESYISILTVGEQKDRNQLMELTVPQLKDEFKRYRLKLDFDHYIQYKLAGAQNLDNDIEDWMKDFHS